MKKSLITILVILGVIIFAGIILIKSNGNIEQQLAKCIGENSELYVQLGCNACGTQTDKFGENKKYLNVIDCWEEREKCSGIEYTPTWIIEGEKYIGVYSIDKLKELTGC
jgi:uncharacterized protein YxeA